MKKGFTYGYDSHRGMLKTEEAHNSMKRLAAMGGDWTALAFTVSQESFSSVNFGFDYRYTDTDSEIITAINRLKALDMKICLKPMVNCRDGVWRAHISFPDIEFPVTAAPVKTHHKTYWDEWFSCYTAFICHYAEIAEDTGCEMLCIGCEMLGTEKKTDLWRKLIEKVRSIYSGELVYNTNHGCENGVEWFDAVDYIGTSAYFPVGRDGSSREDMMRGWERVKPDLKAVSEKFGKKVIFMEIGCRSAKGCSAMPWDFLHTDLPYDEDGQDRFYDTALEVFSGEPWFDGFFWWDWQTVLDPSKEYGRDRGFSIIGKKAEQTVTKWYSGK